MKTINWNKEIKDNYRYVEKLCRKYENDPLFREELVQTVFERIYRFRDTFKGDSDIRTWMHRVAENICKNYLRDNNLTAKDPEPEPILNEYNEEVSPSRWIEEHVSSSDPTPEEWALAEEWSEEVEDTVDSLPPRLREVYDLNEQGYTATEISKRLGIANETVRWSIHEIKKLLKHIDTNNS